MSNKNILILSNSVLIIYNFRKELVERLLEEDYKVYISSPYGERIDELIDMGCKYIETDFDRHGTNIFDELKLLLYYRKIIKKVDPEVVLSYTIKPNIYGGIACRFLNVPYIANITGLGIAVKNEGLMQKISILLYKFAFKDINTIFLQNKENQKFFIDNNIATEEHRLIPGSGVNLNEFNVLDYPANSKIKLLMISRIMEEKGVEEFFDAAKHFKKDELEFHICGFFEEEKYKSKIKKLENKNIVKYHGMVRDVRKYIAKTHCTVHPSYHEGMSNVLLESAASGRPLISTDVSGCQEIVDDGINGYLVKKEDSEDLIEKINKFLDLSHAEKKEMGLAGRKKVEEEFDRQIVIDAYMEEIKKLI